MVWGNKTIAAVDIGTTKVVAIAGNVNSEGHVNVTGFGQACSKGIVRGSIFNVVGAAEAVKEAVRMAEKSAGRIKEVYVNISGQHFKTFHTRLPQNIANGVVSQSDVDMLFQEIKKARFEARFEDYRAYYEAPQLFCADDEEGIADPVGVVCNVLSLDFKLISAPRSYGDNLKMCLDNAGLTIKKSIPDSLANSEVLLTDEEKELGVVLLDIGGTTKFAVYSEGILVYSAVIPFGGEVITKDIREGCAILPHKAEQLKVRFGQAMGEMADANKIVAIPGINGRSQTEISFRNLAYIIQARMEEIIEAVYYQLKKLNILDKINTGIVLTGGTSNLPNLVHLLTLKTGLEVRKGIPTVKIVTDIQALAQPEYTTALGLLVLGLKEAGEFKTKRKKRKESNPIQKKKEPGIIEVMAGQLMTKINKKTNKIADQIADQYILPFFEEDAQTREPKPEVTEEVEDTFESADYEKREL